MTMHRRAALALLSGAALGIAAAAGPGPARAESPVQLAQFRAGADQITEYDRVLGSADAPVTIIEYASLTCPHCAAFHVQSLPTIKAEYIDTGIARLVYRDFPLDGTALRASMLARCVPEEQYFDLLSVLFQTQRQWASAGDPVAALGQIAGMAGLGADAFNACMADTALADAIIAQRQEGGEFFQVASTPTFIINGESTSGALPPDEFGALIERAAPGN